MYCPKCGIKVNDGANYCRSCGKKVNNNTDKTYNQLENNNVVKEPLQQKISFEEQLLNAYIGINADNIKKESFSLPACFLSIIYLLYRKMWSLAIVVFTVAIMVMIFLPPYATIIFFVVDIILGIKFNEMYVNHAKEQINEIRRKNPNASNKELLELCTKKGDVSSMLILAIFSLGIVIFVLTLINCLIFDMSDNGVMQAITNYEKEKSQAIGKLKYSIPRDFKYSKYESYNYGNIWDTDFHLDRFYRDSVDSCYANIEAIPRDNKSMEALLKSNIHVSADLHVSSVKKKTINNKEWSFIEVTLYSYSTTSYYYGLIDGSVFYGVVLEDHNLDSVSNCPAKFEEIINSLEVR